VPRYDAELNKLSSNDPAFKAELIANPAAALKAEGIDVPAGVAVTVVENTDKQFHLVLPPVPTDELSDEALDAVAGGFGGGCIMCSTFVSAASPAADVVQTLQGFFAKQISRMKNP
jgi:hypothetical protein